MVTDGSAPFLVTCNSDMVCLGSLTLYVPGTFGSIASKHHKTRQVCGKKTHYRVKPHKKGTVKVRLRKACLTAIKHHHHLGANLVDQTASGQKGFTKHVTLIG